MPSLFPLNNVNGPVPRHIREAAGGTANTKALPNKKTERVIRANTHTKKQANVLYIVFPCKEKRCGHCACVSACARVCSSPTRLSPPRQHKEQESIELNGHPSASWLELNGNVKLATDPFCLSVEGLVSPGSPNRIIPS